MSKDVKPFLMFTQGGCEEAINFYVSLFSDGAIDQMHHFPEDGSPNAGQVMLAEFTLNGQTFIANDSLGVHKFDFTPSFSIYIECDNAEELDGLYIKLGMKGKVLMPVDNYGFSARFAWVQDRFGVSWQLNVPAVD